MKTSHYPPIKSSILTIEVDKVKFIISLYKEYDFSLSDIVSITETVEDDEYNMIIPRANEIESTNKSTGLWNQESARHSKSQSFDITFYFKDDSIVESFKAFSKENNLLNITEPPEENLLKIDAQNNYIRISGKNRNNIDFFLNDFRESNPIRI